MKEQIVYGFNAVSAALSRRPESILRLFFTNDMAPRFGAICSDMAKAHKIYRAVDDKELETICRSSHHGGVVAVFQGRMLLSPDAATVASWKAEKARVLVFDDIGNSHNMGAMIRTAAFLGITNVLVDRQSAATLQSPSSARIAEGGLEVVRVWEVDSVGDFLTEFKSDLVVVGTDQKARTSLEGFRVQSRAWDGALCIVMGNEEEGMSPIMRALCDELIAIPGSGVVESLNVAQAAAICMYVLGGSPAVATRAPKPKKTGAKDAGAERAVKAKAAATKARTKTSALPRPGTVGVVETRGADGKVTKKKVFRVTAKKKD